MKNAHQSRSLHRVLEQITDPIFRLQAKLLYGTGMRLLECLRLRVKDIDFGQHLIVVRGTKGNEDRVTLPPEQLEPILQEHLTHVKMLYPTFRTRQLLDIGIFMHWKICAKYGFLLFWTHQSLIEGPRLDDLQPISQFWLLDSRAFGQKLSFS